ncbi:hypothetical protein [Enterococcus sp. AZ194]|uniref:hypothetical protein n=1 Tax=Enterococcus sp. AZ194 TaxID=2774629 RepID=UPI003F685C8E
MLKCGEYTDNAYDGGKEDCSFFFVKATDLEINNSYLRRSNQYTVVKKLYPTEMKEINRLFQMFEGYHDEDIK